MVHTPVRWSWFRPVNENKNGDPIKVYCCLCKKDIADGEERASSDLDRRPHCEECALENGAHPPGEKPPKRKNAENKSSALSTPNAVASSESIQLLKEIRDLLRQLVKASGLKTEVMQDFSPPEKFPDLAVFGDGMTTEEYRHFVDWVEDINDDLARFLGEHCKSFSYEDSTANIGITSQFVSYAEKNRKLLSSYFPAKTQVNFVPVNR